MTFKSPMLAKDYDESALALPKWASVKLDGWRAVIHQGVVTTRSGKPVRNKHVQSIFGHHLLEGLDGELVVGAWNEQSTFNRTDAALKREEGEPDVVFYVFDVYDQPNQPYWHRELSIKMRIQNWESQHFNNADLRERVRLLPQTKIGSLEELDEYERDSLSFGFEGVMLRDFNATYKYGRSTVNEAKLLKVKRFTDAEATIVRLEEQMSNQNEAFKDELGRTKRSSHKENLTPTGMVGSIWVTSPEWEGEFRVSAGSMSHVEKKAHWANRDALVGETIKFKYLEHGVKDVPRHGVFVGFRAAEDANIAK